LAIALAFGGSVVATLLGSQAVYFESVAMFVFFLLLGRTIESGLRERVAARMAGLAEQLPAAVRRLVGESQETVGLLELNVGDRILLLPGETVPVDGELLDAQAQVSEAFLSGESRPLPRRAGETVLAGSCVVGQPLQLQVSAIGEATALGELERLVSRASQGRAAWTRLADRAAQAFALIVLVAASATLLLWAGSGAEQALSATVAVLAAACPCALALALPTALAAATRALAQQQVLMVRAGGLERLASVDCVVFDKTGTLTEPSLQPSVQLLDPQLTQDEALALAAALERCSLHPLARAFAAADDGRVVEQAFEQTGAGVRGRIDGQDYRLGRASYCGLPNETDADLWLVRGQQPLARFSLDQQLRADARLTVARLRELGLPVLLYSGDHPDAVATVAAQLQVDDHAGGLRPEDKLARLQQLQQQGRRVLMVGDGMNDAPVLAAAHASLALAQGADMARQQADGVIGGGRLQQVAEALLLARAARRTIVQNLLWAGGYNLLAVPAAALGLLSPWAAALGMSLSSLLVLANAMRLLRQPKAPPSAIPTHADEPQAAA
ncbi:MAG: cadmium-translocating P-type ATPase, partial [Xanthomonadales bacterium]|nr:cadmium-translocating P-type ATPase [Xanthomonadales bacterium]